MAMSVFQVDGCEPSKGLISMAPRRWTISQRFVASLIGSRLSRTPPLAKIYFRLTSKSTLDLATRRHSTSLARPCNCQQHGAAGRLLQIRVRIPMDSYIRITITFFEHVARGCSS